MWVLAVAGLVILAGCNGDTNALRARDARVSLTSASTSVAATGLAGAPEPVVPIGFERTRARVVAADGEICELCVWIAESERQRADGLMGVTELGDAEAMAFIYPRPTTTTFWMYDTMIPLSIAFFDERGRWLAEFDMDPCTQAPCPQFRTAERFSIAVEAPQGELATMLIGAGSTLELLDLPCDPAD